jgi:hypothetical protein
MFDGFGVAIRIKYGTFNEVCEDFINLEIDVRKATETLILSGGDAPPPYSGDRLSKGYQAGALERRVLLIDEVDVFFTKVIFNIHCPRTAHTSVWTVRERIHEFR